MYVVKIYMFLCFRWQTNIQITWTLARQALSIVKLPFSCVPWHTISHSLIETAQAPHSCEALTLLRETALFPTLAQERCEWRTQEKVYTLFLVSLGYASLLDYLHSRASKVVSGFPQSALRPPTKLREGAPLGLSLIGRVERSHEYGSKNLISSLPRRKGLYPPVRPPYR